MNSLFQKYWHVILIMCLCVNLAACNRLNQSNFEKIKQDMSVKEVVSILGEPTHSDSVTIAGISGTASTWKNESAEINIQFLNDKVFAKSFSKSTDEKNSR